MTDETISEIGTVAGVVANAALAVVMPSETIKFVVQAFIKYGPDVAKNIAHLFAKTDATLQDVLNATTIPDYDSFGIKDAAARDAK